MTRVLSAQSEPHRSLILLSMVAKATISAFESGIGTNALLLAEKARDIHHPFNALFGPTHGRHEDAHARSNVSHCQRNSVFTWSVYAIHVEVQQRMVKGRK